MTTHYGIIHFTGDYDNDHPDPKLRGTSPHLELIAKGDEQFCWNSIDRWVRDHPLQRNQTVEVVARDPLVVQQEQERADAYLKQLRDDDQT